MAEPLTGAIALPDGTLIRGRGRRDPMPSGPLPEYGLYLGHDPDVPRRFRLGRQETWRPDWPADWVEWPDFRLPTDAEAAAAAIDATYRRAVAGERVEVACGGGTGRTGTVIACMAVLAGCPAAEALAWTREHYKRRAVETPGQRRWIGWFAEHRP
jgi:hypothetical protein